MDREDDDEDEDEDDGFMSGPIGAAVAYGVLWYMGIMPGCDIDADARDLHERPPGVERTVGSDFYSTNYVPPR